MRESSYQASLIKRLRVRFPGCVILKNDSGYIQGIPDLLVLWSRFWAMLEVKASALEEFQPNQKYYIEKLNSMSYAAVIYPSNEEAVLHDLQQAFESAADQACISLPQ